MLSVRCPECGQRLKYRGDDVRMRCPECRVTFRAPDGNDEEYVRPQRKRKSAKKSSHKVLIAAITGGLVGVAAITLVVVLLVSGTGGQRGSAEVSAESYKKVHAAMTLEEVEAILGKGRRSSDQDMLKAFVRKEGRFRGKVVWGEDPTPPNRPMEWRRWDANRIRIWVAFLKTKYRLLSAFGVFVEDGDGHRNVNSFTHLEAGLEKLLEDAYSARMQTIAIRKDAKWVRGQRGQAPILGDWRNETGQGLLFEPGGKLRDRNDLPRPNEPNRRPIYRFVGDDRLEITRRRHGDARVSLYDFFVFEDELVLIDVTPGSPNHHKAQFYYRMPPKAGNMSDVKILQPLIADAKNPDRNKHVDASWKLMRLGKHGLPALRELERTSVEPMKSHFQRTIRAAEVRAAEDELN